MSTSSKDVPPHPGRVLHETYMYPSDMSCRQLARDLRVRPSRITRLVSGEISMTVDTARKLEKRFGRSARDWMILQVDHDLAVATVVLRT